MAWRLNVAAVTPSPMPKKPTIGNLVWSTKQRAYFRGTHKLTQAEMSDRVNAVVSNAADRVGKLSRKLVSGSIQLTEWRKGMDEALTHGHRAMAMLAVGGQSHMTPELWEQVQRLIDQQAKYLARFYGQLNKGRVKVDDALVSRARMYMDALYATHENFALERERLAGVKKARRVLGGEMDGHNCDGCVAQAKLGWQPIEKIERLGLEDCLSRCRCRFETRGV